MNRRIISVLSIALGLMGATACNSDPNRKVEMAQAEQREDNREAAREQNELAVEQRQERNELAQDQREDNDSMNERAEERNELAQEQTEERKDLVKDQREEQVENRQNVREAAADSTDDKQEYARNSRERLRKAEARVQEIRKEGVPADATATMNAMPRQIAEADRDITALESVKAANWEQQRNSVDRKLAGLERSIDRVEARK